MKGNSLGYDLNETYCQISFYNEKKQEPQTMEFAADNYQIPFVIGRKGDLWLYGNDAKQLEEQNSGFVVSNLYEKACRHEQVQMGDEAYEAEWLLTKFIKLTLERFEQITHIVFAIPKMDMEMDKILKEVGIQLGVARENVYVQDYKEAFCNYMIHQPKELWQYEVALFHCNQNKMYAYMFRKLRAGIGKGKDTFVTVEELACEQIQELARVAPVMDVDCAKKADEHFKMLAQSVFEKRMISSVFLTGEGFETNWYPVSLKVLCNGRRVFLGNNLYSKGACYTAFRKNLLRKDGIVYLDETKMTDQISLRMRVDGTEVWYPIVAWGGRWYEADKQFEVLLEDAGDVELRVESLVRTKIRTEVISMSELPKRKNYALRLQVKVTFLNENTCKISFQDVGFGEFFPATDFHVEKIIQLGGSNGQFDSLL